MCHFTHAQSSVTLSKEEKEVRLGFYYKDFVMVTGSKLIHSAMVPRVRSRVLAQIGSKF